MDAVYMQATTAMTGQGGWPMTVVLTPEGEPFFAGTYFPDQPRQGQPSFRQILEGLHVAWTQRRDEVRTVAGDVSAHLRSAGMPAGEQPLDADLLAGAVRTLAGDFDGADARLRGSAEVPAVDGAGVPAPARGRAAATSPGTAAQAGNMAAATLTAMARGGIYDQLAGGFARYSVDRVLGGAALREDALRQRPAPRRLRPLVAAGRQPAGRSGHPRDRSVPARGPADARGRLRLGTRRRHRRGRGQVLRLVARRARRGARPRRRRLGGGTARRDRGGHVRARHVDPPAARGPRSRPLGAPARPAAHRTGPPPAPTPPATTRWSPPGTASRSPSLAEAGALLGEPEYVDAALDAGRLLVSTCISTTAGCCASRATAWPAGTRECWRTTRCVAQGFLALHAVTGDRSWFDHADALLDRALDAFAAGDGGFHDTASDAESLVSRPRDPSRQRQPVRSVGPGARPARATPRVTGSGRHRDAAEAALRHVRTLAERAPRFAGWSLAAAEAALDGPLEVAVVGRPDDPAYLDLLRTARATSRPGLRGPRWRPGRRAGRAAARRSRPRRRTGGRVRLPGDGLRPAGDPAAELRGPRCR